MTRSNTMKSKLLLKKFILSRCQILLSSVVVRAYCTALCLAVDCSYILKLRLLTEGPSISD